MVWPRIMLPRGRQILKVEEQDMQKITPFLWFDNRAEEAVNFYTSKRIRKLATSRAMEKLAPGLQEVH
jgi:hypothetical protein